MASSLFQEYKRLYAPSMHFKSTALILGAENTSVKQKIKSLFTHFLIVPLKSGMKIPEVRFKIRIDLGAKQYNPHTHIKPEHRNDYCGKTAIHAEPAKIINIDRKYK